MYKLLSLLLAGLLLAGCRKDDLVECYPTTGITVPASSVSNLSLAEFSRRNGAAVQSFTISLNQDQTVTTTGGASLTFPASLFKLPNGTLAVGTAQVKVREIYTVPEMVLANMPTTMVQSPIMLISGGEFNIQVTQQGTRLQLDRDSLQGRTLVSRSPIPAGQDTTAQRLWRQSLGGTVNGAAAPAGWLQSYRGNVQLTPGYYRASIPLDSISWWNIDQFWHAYQGAASVPVSVTTPATAAGETRVYLRPVGYNGLAPLYATSATGTLWQTTVPTGAVMKAVVLQSVSGQLYFGTQQLTVQSGLSITPTLTPVSEAEAVRLIRQL